MKALTVLTLFILSFVSLAQTPQDIVSRDSRYHVYEGAYRFIPVWYEHPRISERKVLDVSTLRITYEALVVADTLSGLFYKDRVITLVGDNIYKSYGEGLWKSNMRVSLRYDSPANTEYYKDYGYSEMLPGAVYRYLEARTLINRSVFPEIKNTFFRYDEPQPEFRWILSTETTEINGYYCYKARTEYHGRDWTVWYTPEIPVDCGLWKFSGLPGLILEACDSRHEYVFTVKSVERKKEPIEWYITRREKVLDREEFREREQNLYDNPLLYSQGLDGYKLIIDESRGFTGHEVFTVDNFIYPYNPIELE